MNKKDFIQGKKFNINSQIYQWYSNELNKMVDKMSDDFYKKIYKLYSKDKEEIKIKVDNEIKISQDDSITSQMRITLNKLKLKYDKYFKYKSKYLVKQFLRKSLKYSFFTFNNSFKNKDFTIQAKYITEELKETIKASIYENVNLIKSINNRYFEEISGAVYRSINNGKGLNWLKEELLKYKEMTKKRSKLIASDQTHKVYSNIQIKNMSSNGIKYFKWVHSGGGKNPREFHKADFPKGLNGGIYSIENPPIIDKNTGERGYPGTLPFCYGKETEILTKKGFKLIKDVKIGEEVATINRHTLQFEWGQVINTIKHYENNIYNMNNNNFNLDVSENHIFWEWKKKYNGKQQIIGSDYNICTQGVFNLSKKNSYFLATCKENNNNDVNVICNLPTEIFVKFLGYYLSDGNIDKRTNNCIHITQTNNDWMYNELKDYMKICKGEKRLFIYNKDLFNVVKDLGNCYHKYIPNFVKELNSKYLKIFLDAFNKCDGNGMSRKNKLLFGKYYKDNRLFYTTSPQMMADLVEIILKTNKSCSITTRKTKGKICNFKNGCYKLNYDNYIIREMNTKIRTMRKMKITKQKYNDYVYDVEVNKNNTLLVKSGKSIHWNSNCRCSMIPIIKFEN